MFNPFNDQKYFHSYCEVSDYSNQTNVQDCWLGDTTVSLPDLNTDREDVQNMWYGWVRSLVSNYSSKSIFQYRLQPQTYESNTVLTMQSRWSPRRHSQTRRERLLARLQQSRWRLLCRRGFRRRCRLYLSLSGSYGWSAELPNVRIVQVIDDAKNRTSSNSETQLLPSSQSLPVYERKHQ